LYFDVNNIGGAGVNIRTGQFRLPFGLWSDITSHRNFTSTKNNMLVNGYALKKIDLGFQVQKQFTGGSLTAAVVHGRQGRTSNLSRATNDNKYDLVVRANLTQPKFQLGASAYLAEFKADRNIAIGGDLLIPSRYVTIAGEFVYQKNSDMRTTHG